LKVVVISGNLASESAGFVHQLVCITNSWRIRSNWRF